MRNIVQPGILMSLLLASTVLNALTLEVNSIGDNARLPSAPVGACDTGAMVPGPGGAATPECSLRAAIQTANGHGGPAQIHFADYISQNSSNPPATMFFPTTALPAFNVPIELDGRTHPAFDTSLRHPVVIVRGDDLSGSENGLVISGSAASGSIIQAVAVYHFPLAGIMITNSNNNRVSESHIGINALGTSARANGYGVSINGGNNNVIGNLPADLTIPEPKPNLISGNHNDGVVVNSGRDSWIANNHIGLNLTGTNVVPNGGRGVAVFPEAVRTRVGGRQTVDNIILRRYNVLAGNLAGQVVIQSNGATNVRCNLIGTRPDLSATLPAPEFGIQVRSSRNWIGDEACENVIATTAPVGIEIGIMTPELEVKADLNNVINAYIGMSPAGAALSGGGEWGIRIANGDNNFIHASHIGNVSRGVEIGFSNGNWLLTSHIGVDANLDPHPVTTGVFSSGQDSTQIGISSEGYANIIGYARTGIDHSGDNSLIRGNWIGTAPDGTDLSRPDGITGIRIAGRNNTVGSRIGNANTVGTFPVGIQVAPITNTGNELIGNAVGVSVDNLPLGNGNGIGIHVQSPDNLLQDNRVGLYGTGVQIDSEAHDIELHGNEIGAGADGVSFGNTGVGLFVLSDNNLIGGAEPEQQNILGDNQDGLVIGGELNNVTSAYIGITPDNLPVGNSRHGIHLLPSASATSVSPNPNNTAGWSYIANNGQHGILNEGVTTTIENVFIGTGTNGLVAGNGGDGIHLATAFDLQELHSYIFRSRILYNQGYGANLENSVRGGHYLAENAMYNNQLGGIHLGPDGRDQDLDDADTGPNFLQNFPEFDLLASGADHLTNHLPVRFRVDSAPEHSAYPLELHFYTASLEPSGAQAFMYVGRLYYDEVDAQQWVTGLVDLEPFVELSPGQVFVATATALGDNAFATSEFSEPFGGQYDPDRIFFDRLEVDPIGHLDIYGRLPVVKRFSAMGAFLRPNAAISPCRELSHSDCCDEEWIC